MRAVEGRIPFHGFHTWYRDVGPEESIPLVCVHGGPGSTHHYFTPLEQLADEGRRVIVYDQLGCGNSDRPVDPDLWTLELFLDELGTLRNELGLDRVHLLGTSWGSMLALEYVLTKPSGLVSLVLNSPPTASETWMAEARRLRDELPDDVARTLAEHEAAGTTDHPDYTAAEEVFWRKHILRLDPPPDFVMRGRAERGKEVYASLWGVSEWNANGKLHDWDVRHRLHEIDVPTLVTSGLYDECTPALAEEAQRLIPDAERVLFEESSHSAYVEEPEHFRAVLTKFLARAEAA
ncbi:MAG TPA: proline iminopeptidase-family hydrolase [Gaiellaceae bacterium]